MSSYLPWRRSKNIVRILRLQGTIQAQSSSPRAVNLRRVEKSIEKAFDVKRMKPKAVCLEINSTGGSAVQSNLIFNRIRSMATENKIPVITFAEDAALSGGYWLALAGDEIYIDQNSFIGSIGALSGNFGLVEAAKKLGIESRLITAGEKKVRMNPFKPENPEDKAHMKGLLDQVHNNFINLVKERRPNIQKDHKTVFEGDFFVGEKAVQIGLADGIVTDMKVLCRKRFGEDVEFQRCDMHGGFWGRLTRGRMDTQASILIDEALDTISVRELQSRYGL